MSYVRANEGQELVVEPALVGEEWRMTGSRMNAQLTSRNPGCRRRAGQTEWRRLVVFFVDDHGGCGHRVKISAEIGGHERTQRRRVSHQRGAGRMLESPSQEFRRGLVLRAQKRLHSGEIEGRPVLLQ